MTVKEQVKELWRICFDDTEAFIELYFKLRYNDRVNIAVQMNNEIISALQMIPYEMTLLGQIIPTSYISGACTHPQYQGKGVMKELLRKSFLRMIDEGILISTLIPAEPWLFDYYARMGYSPVFNYSTRTLLASELKPSSAPISIKKSTVYSEDIYRYLNRKMHERPCCIQHTADDFNVVVADLILSQGQTLSAHRQEEITGIVLAAPKDEVLEIKELFAEDKETTDQLLWEASRLYPDCRQISVVSPMTGNSDETTVRLGMARIIHTPLVLQLYAVAFPEVTINIALTDHQLPMNTGFFKIAKGECEFSITKEETTNYQMMTVNELTRSVLEPLHPYMSLMLN
ncbi:MAG: GNAT family N-acetyltransferase [Bacteroides sp.]|nr:GNAT family N-acetyltransferase [Bacteroides sp.]